MILQVWYSGLDRQMYHSRNKHKYLLETDFIKVNNKKSRGWHQKDAE